MSHQKVMLVVGVAAFAFVGLVAGQLADMNTCTSATTEALRKYQSGITSALNTYQSELTQLGMSAMDGGKVSEQVAHLTTTASGLTDFSQGFDAQRVMNIMMELTRTQFRLSTMFLNPQLGLAGGRSYAKLLTTIMNLNTNLALEVPSSCLSGARIGSSI